MRPYRARFREQGVFFAFQSWAGCITNIFGFDLRQAQARISASSSFLAATMNQKSSLRKVPQSVSRALTANNLPISHQQHEFADAFVRRDLDHE